MTRFFDLQAPTEWVTTPDRFSFTSLRELQICPRRWQLLCSRWGEHDRFPQLKHPSAVEGIIVHAATDRLVKALGRHGLPRPETPAFKAAMAEADLRGFVAKELAEHQGRQASLPYGDSASTLRVNADTLVNRVFRALRKSYRPDDARQPVTGRGRSSARHHEAPGGGSGLLGRLRAIGSLSEVLLQHPSLPLHGRPDMVNYRDGGVQIIEFKGGVSAPEHRTQLQLYGLLWWRETGVPPQTLTLQHPSESIHVEAGTEALERVEGEMAQAIADARRGLEARPADARPGPACRSCPTRARCGPGWDAAQRAAPGDEATRDLEVTVRGTPTPGGFMGEAQSRTVSVVYGRAEADMLPALRPGLRLRLVDIGESETSGTFEVRPWTGPFVVHEDGEGGNETP